MYVFKICLNSVPGGPINSILGGWHYDDPPTSGAQNDCHGNTGCLATEPRNLHFMIEYIKNAKAYINFKIGTYLQDVVRSHDPIFVKVGQRSRSYKHIMY